MSAVIRESEHCTDHGHVARARSTATFVRFGPKADIADHLVGASDNRIRVREIRASRAFGSAITECPLLTQSGHSRSEPGDV
jgi:hypothetical protein